MSQFNSAFAVSLHCTRSDARVRFDSGGIFLEVGKGGAKAGFRVMLKYFELLRSTKWNANLILLRDYGELVALCKVIG